MKPEKLKVLVVTEVSADAAQIARLLADHFEHVETSTVETRFVADFERVKPDVVVLAFNSLERAERYSLGLYRQSEIVHTLPHRNIVLCDKDSVHRAFELCSKAYFDDYVMYWPLVYDTPRLAMSILIAGRSLQAQRDTTPAHELAAHARSVSRLESVLDDRIAAGQQHAEALSKALDAVASDNSFELPTVTDASFDLDLDGVPTGADLRPPLAALTPAAPPRADAIRALQSRVDDAQHKVVPLTEWIGGLKQDVKPQLDAARQLGERAGRTPPLVVVVDDDSFQCKLLERLLGAAGYRSTFAHSGTEALVLLGRQHPDLILMDVGLPDLNGVEITRRLKASPQLANIPILMITGHSERQVLEASLKAGAVDFLVKPFDREVLLQKLARHLP